MTLRSASISDIGRVRKENEDRFLCDDSLSLYGVADGIGGLPCGGEAAARTVAMVLENFRQTPTAFRAESLEACVLAANREVLHMGRILSPLYGVGTTLSFGCVVDKRLYLAHVGDSRCYLVRKGVITQLTTDHNVENEARARRAQGMEDIFINDRNRGALTKCIGQLESPNPDLMDYPLEKGDRILFCTDGVTRMLEDEELGDIISETPTLDLCVATIVKLANERGGFDNATAVLVQAG